jgi:branched-chain amino acid transport system ATP-binding protein
LDLSVDWIGIKSFLGDFGLRNHRPPAIPPSPEKAVAPARVAGDALLIDQQQHGVPVAIEAELAQKLNLSGGLSFTPQFRARPRPVAGAAFGQAHADRIAVHPSHHQDLARIVLLGDGRHETVGTEPDLGQRAFDLILHLSRPSARCPCHIFGLGWAGNENNTCPASAVTALRLDDLILETRGLTKEFRGFTAVQGVDLKIRRGTIHALIGPNGAGKTTVFNLLTKFLEPSAGAIIYDGHDITTERPADIARRGMVRSFQISAVFPHLTVRDNVRVALQQKLGNSFHFWRSERVLDGLNARADTLLEAVGLSGFGDALATDLPYGRKRALEIATTLALDPVMLLLDEPMAGLGQEDIGRISALIRAVSADRTVLMVEHNLSVVADLSHIITVLTRGRILAEGDYAAVSSNPEVVEAYLGTGHA